MSFPYVVTAQHSSAVTCTLMCNFTNAVGCDLVVCKGCLLEIYNFVENSLNLVFSRSVYGKIVSIDKYRVRGKSLDNIFILTERKQYCIIAYDTQLKQVLTKTTGNVKDRVGREIETGMYGLVDGTNNVIGMLLHEGLLKLVPVDPQTGDLREPFNIHMDEIRQLDLKFLRGYSRPTFAILYEDHKGNRHVKTYAVDLLEKEVTAGPWNRSSVSSTASMIIPVGLPSGGIILVGSNIIQYINGSDVMVSPSVAVQPSQFLAFCSIENDPCRYLVSDVSGLLYVVILSKSENSIVGIAVEPLGYTSIAHSLAYIGNGYVYVGSRFGDSQLIKLLSMNKLVRLDSEHNGLSSNAYVEIVERFTNVGPIFDMVSISEQKGAEKLEGCRTQSQIITCSGAYKDGSLCTIRSGIGIHQEALLEIEGIRDLWSLRSGQFDRYLIQSYISETRVLEMSGEEMQESEISGFDCSVPTVFCSNINENVWLQVTASGLRLIDGSTGKLLKNVTLSSLGVNLCSVILSDEKCTLATANCDQIVIATSKRKILYFLVTIVNNNLTVELQSSVSVQHDIACLSTKPVGLTSSDMEVDSPDSVSYSDVSGDKSTVLCVGLWGENSVYFYGLPQLHLIANLSLSGDAEVNDAAQIRDVTMIELSRGFIVLLVGLGDGVLISYLVDYDVSNSTVISFRSRRSVSIGSQAISFACFTNSNSLCVLASCDRPTVIYQQNNKLLFSVAYLSGDEPDNQSGTISIMTRFHCEMFPEALALYSPGKGLIIATLDEIKKLHVYKHFLNEMPKRICYSREHGLFAVITEKSTFQKETGMTIKSNRVLFLRDNGNFDVIHVHTLDPLEAGLSCCCMNFAIDETTEESLDLDLQNSPTANKSKEYFIIGTSRMIPGEIEPSRGRILLFDISFGCSGKLNSGYGVQSTDSQETTFDQSVTLLYEKDVRGAVFSISPILGRVAVAVSSKVAVFSCSSPINGRVELNLDCMNSGHVMAITLKTKNDLIIVGDLLRSISVLKYTPPSVATGSNPVPASLSEIARDSNINPLRAVEFFGLFGDLNSGSNYYVGAEDFGNIFVAKRQIDDVVVTADFGARNVSDVEKSRLLICSEFHMGDNINTLIAGTLNDQPSESAEGTDGGVHFSLLYGTTTGTIGCILSLSEEDFTFCRALEKAMSSVIAGIGGFSHQDFRTFYNGKKASGNGKSAIDGDLVELFLDLKKDEKEIVVLHLNDNLRPRLPPSTSTSSLSGSSSQVRVKSSYTLEEVCVKVDEYTRLH